MNTQQTTAITVLAPRSLEEARTLASTLAPALTLPESLRGKPADVLAIIMTGAELGFHPMQAIRGLQIIKGKVTLSGAAMAALVRKQKDVCEKFTIDKSDNNICTITTKRVDSEPLTMSFTIEDARKANLGGDNWTKYPKAMLLNRAITQICRAEYPDIIMGMYDPEEISVNTPLPSQAIDGEVIQKTKTEHAKEKLRSFGWKEQKEVVNHFAPPPDEPESLSALQMSEPPPEVQEMAHEMNPDSPPLIRVPQDDSGPYVIKFGKHKDKSISDVPVDYLNWLHGSLLEKEANKKMTDRDIETMQAVKLELKRRG